MTQVDTFSKVEITTKTLVLLDIDETILFYDNIDETWWDKTIDYHVHTQKCDLATASRLATDDWFRYIKENLPKHTDKVGFETLMRAIKETHSDLLFITARNRDYKQITNEHFTHLGLQHLEEHVHYLGGEPKGEYIKQNIDTSAYERIVFIDDLVRNIASVTDALNPHCTLHTYQFVRDRT